MNEKYESLKEEINSTVTEAVHNSRWDLIAGYHKVGELIVGYVETENVSLNKTVQGLGQDLGKSRSTLHYAAQFYKKYPDINTLPDGKNASWNKIVLSLPAGEGEDKKTPPSLEERLLAWATDEVRDNHALPYASPYPVSILIEKLKSKKQERGVLSVRGTPNEDVNEVIGYFKYVMKLPALDGTVKETRQYAYLLLKNRGGLEQVKNLIQIASMDTFWNSKLASLKMLYYKSMQILKSRRDTPKKGVRI